MKKHDKVFGNYRILDEIAEGGFGKTYKAEHIELGTLVCIKHSPLRISESFRRVSSVCFMHQQ